ncbi:uncharacterized protein LOC108034284 [Drosophila biarmipes]|uniref:uncharacterized protein LOC108034284 n=1 Tax=Drosophila biarmipes TaxID=125945 RepID=UPI0007E85FB8|nr:uncharacterized protein LOC108034284 [Drosophila biarmipes]XP_050740980.1 uncharacterized protein LOC108034284 [Drosophila biarmipes]
MNLKTVLAIIAIFFLKSAHVYSSFPTDINKNYFDTGNLTLPRTTSHPHTYRTIARYFLPLREIHNEEEKPYGYGEYFEDREIPKFPHKRVAREQATQQQLLHGRSVNGNLVGQFDDNHLHFDTADDGNDEFLLNHASMGTAKREIQSGNANALEDARLRKANNARNRALKDRFEAHRLLVINNGKCRWPRPEVVYIATETDTVYSPRATILHRCSDKIGCCEPQHTCTMKTNETVELVFTKWKTNLEYIKKSMVNHTECECVFVETRRKRSPICQCPRHFSDFGWTGSLPAAEEVEHREPRCRCDCHLSDDTCQRLKNGFEGFSVMERRRIQSGEVSPPFCNFGPYDIRNGRCPRPGIPNQNLKVPQYIQSRRQHGKS